MKIVFIQQRCFLQTKQHTNPLFDPIIQVCEKNGIEWEVWLTDRNLPTGYPSKNVRKYGWRNSAITAGLLFFNRLCKIPIKISYTLIRLFFKPLRILDTNVSLFVTNGLYLIDSYSILYPGKNIIELQHGILYPSHFGYFSSNGTLHQNILSTQNLIFWFFGDYYKNIFLKNPTNANKLSGRLETIGDLRKHNDRSSPHSTTAHDKTYIIIASQMVMGTEFSPKDLVDMKSSYENALDTIYSILQKNNTSNKYIVLFRNHPRFFNCIDLNDWKEKYPSLITDNTENWDELYPKTKVLLTINSTSAFDAASFGVPTVIIKSPNNKFRNILVDDFGYPFPNLTIEEYLLMSNVAYEEKCQLAHNWYKNHYSTFDSENCLALLRKAINT